MGENGGENDIQIVVGAGGNGLAIQVEIRNAITSNNVICVTLGITWISQNTGQNSILIITRTVGNYAIIGIGVATPQES